MNHYKLLFYFDDEVLSYEIQAIKDYINHSTEGISELQSKFIVEAKEILKENPSIAEDLQNRFHNDYVQYNTFFPTLFYNSMVIWLISFYENNMKVICEKFEEVIPLNIKALDLKGQGIKRYEKYLQIVVQLDLSSLNEFREALMQFYNVRNIFVHNNSSIMEDSNKLLKHQTCYQFVKQNQHLKLNEETFIVSIEDKKFLIDLTNTIDKYLNLLFDLINQNAEPFTGHELDGPNFEIK